LIKKEVGWHGYTAAVCGVAMGIANGSMGIANGSQLVGVFLFLSLFAVFACFVVSFAVGGGLINFCFETRKICLTGLGSMSIMCGSLSLRGRGIKQE